ncbi:MAG: DUF2752 domain-containing protein [Verrucomicrobiales bacterium]|nr:DUF2752 domain-containing protein [Verrucomicrobiales bacterium]
MRRYERLVAPSVSLFAVLALLIGARTYQSWPVKAPPCSLRVLTGIPCIGCGGTRAMEALSRADVVEALRYNPLVVLGVLVIVLWFFWALLTFKSKRRVVGESKKMAKVWTVMIFLLVLLNWIYLICYLPF